ncbi:urate hydroxylase PuuD [Solemya elarraichensis gill symbiont]|uniref:urate hydroxylase PuuD n=1 Tax=Solemya elarraichensis gill symbiont TaxID=1918949 RepID=UPI0009975090|nr:urate hydroxylase PuuD [Solemya elarraichensis gill symbiont]
MNPLASRGGTVILGVVLSVIFIFLLRGDGAANITELTVWFHVVVGIAWVGLLYYFNAVQMPAVAQALSDGDPGPAAINKYVAPRALFWFRWAALLTWLSGAAALGKMGIMGQAFTFEGFTFATASINAIGMGAWLGTIMLLNVWGLIWPNQKKILGMKQATPEEIAKAKKIATMASRINTALSIPMLLGMTAYGHGFPF